MSTWNDQVLKKYNKNPIELSYLDFRILIINQSTLIFKHDTLFVDHRTMLVQFVIIHRTIGFVVVSLKSVWIFMLKIRQSSLFMNAKSSDLVSFSFDEAFYLYHFYLQIEILIIIE